MERPEGPLRRGRIPAAVGALLLPVAAGCQSYHPAPLDLQAHREALTDRAAHPEPVAQFASRLAASDHPAPDRFDLGDGLSPSEGEVLALFYNPDLRLARLEAGIALARSEHAGLWEDPVFGFDAAEILSPANPFEYGLTLSLTIPLSGRLAVEKDVALAAHEVELRRIVDAEWTLRTRVRIAWAQWAASRERVALLQDVATQADHIASITDRLAAAAELTRVEARLIRAQLASLRADLAAAERDEAGARIGLLGLMGLSPDADVRLIPDLPATLAAHPEDEIDRLITANTSLAVARAEYQVAEQALRLEIRKQFPDLTIGSGYGSEDDQRLLLGASFPIPVLNANRAGIAEAAARRDLARATAEVTFERLTRELALARASLSAAERQRRAFEAELVPMMDEQIREIERLAELGEVDTPLLLETLTRGFGIRNELLELRIAEISAAATIARLLGPDSVASPTPIAEPPSDPHSDSSLPTIPQETQQ